MARWGAGDHKEISGDSSSRYTVPVPAHPLSSEEKARGEANLAPFVAQMRLSRGDGSGGR